MTMKLQDAGVVITGGGGGIGAAMARKFAAAGARLVLADISAGPVNDLAAELDATAVVGDAASEDGVASLIDHATAALGSIDLFCANAGIANLGGPELSDEIWDRTWEVNVMAHVRAARLLLPGWLDRGEGRFLVTASAAGIVTSLGAAPYAVTKHAALAFAEWMSATYRHRGITVQAICPLGVHTKMLEDTGPGGQLMMGADAISPDQLADVVADALEDDRFLILPHPQVRDYFIARASDTDRWLGGMSKLQRQVEAVTAQ
ncbi:MAG TPA: SDR family oxidoreductase [Galbitalea sp.]|nr:SDR family oxidoreductase [Galbitalea sp.]